MKRILRFGDYYALPKHKLKQFNMQYISLLAVTMITCLQARAQQQEHFTVIGKVISAASGVAIEGATVRIKSSTLRVATDNRGLFGIESIPGEKLIITAVGYETQELLTEEGEFLEVALTPAVNELTEVEINAGYYTTSRERNTGNISRISSQEIGNQPVGNPLGALIGRMAGVNIEQQSGINGGGFKVEIRGVNSLRAEARQPLYLVDGIPFPANPVSFNGIGANNTAGSNNTSPLNYISPSSIESIDVLKDADATAIYGSRGANGVILIRTKRAQSGQSAFTLDFNTGMSKVPIKIDLLNTDQYITMREEAFIQDDVAPLSTSYDINGTWDRNRYTDWQQVLIGGTAKQSNINASYRGGNELTRFSVNGNYSKRGTVFPGDFAEEKGAVALTINHVSDNKKFNITLTTNYLVDRNNLPQYDLTQYIDLAPNAPVLHDDKGNLNWEINDAGAPTWNNPMFGLHIPYLGKTGNLISNMVLSYEIVDGLAVKSSLGYTNINLRETNTSLISRVAPSPSATASRLLAHTNLNTWIVEPQIEYKRRVDNWTLNVLIGSTFQADNSSMEGIFAGGYTNDLLLGNISVAPTKNAFSSSSQYRYNALFGRVNYNHSDKYIFNLTARRDGSSRFGPDKQFANFGAIGFAWLFSKEHMIMNAIPWLSFGKLRGSYGTTGSDQIPDYGYLETYTATTYAYRDGPGFYPSRIANPDYSWETNKKLEIGLEIGFLEDRVFLSSSWYKNRSSNQLVGYTLPDITGFPTIQFNLPATVQNTGLELELNTINMKKEGFAWKSAWTFSRPRNKLVSYPNIEGSPYFNTYTVGKSLYTPKVYEYLGLDPQTGVFTYTDVDGSGAFNAADRLAADEPLATKWYGGLNNRLRFGPFEINVFFQYVNKNARPPFLQFNSPGTFVNGMLGNQPINVLERWQKPGDVADIQKFSQIFSSGSAYQRFTYLNRANVFTSASFIRLKNVAINWNIPQKWLSNSGFKNIMLYVQGQNLFTITGYMGDPETTRIKSLPTLRTWVIGVNVAL